MSYYVTMDAVDFRSLLSPDEMREAVKKANIPNLGYRQDSDSDFTIASLLPDNEPPYVYEVIPFNGDYYFKYHSEVIDPIVGFLKTVIAPDAHTTMIFSGDDNDIWGYFIKNDGVYDISYRLVVKTPAGDVDLNEFEK